MTLNPEELESTLKPHKEEMTLSEQRQLQRLPSMAELAFDSLINHNEVYKMGIRQ